MEKENDYIFSKRLSALRKEAEITINKMAYETDISASAISYYERGVRIPDGKTLIKLAKYFGCTTDFLLGLSDCKNEKDKIQMQEFVGNIFKSLNLISTVDRGRLIELFEITLEIYAHFNKNEYLQKMYVAQAHSFALSVYSLALLIKETDLFQNREDEEVFIEIISNFEELRVDSISNTIDFWQDLEDGLSYSYPNIDMKNINKQSTKTKRKANIAQLIKDFKQSDISNDNNETN